MSWAKPVRGEEGLPSIRRSGLLDHHSRSPRLTHLDDSVVHNQGFGASRVRFSSAGHSRTSERPLFHPAEEHTVTTSTTTHINGLKNGYSLIEHADEVKMLKSELEKRDKLIQELSSMDASMPKFEFSKFDEAYSTEKMNALAAAKSELAAYKVRVEALTSELRETNVQLENREQDIKQLKHEVEMSREQEAKQTTLAHSLKQRVIEFEAQFGSLEGAANRGEIAIQTLQSQLKESNEKILELESRLRKHMEERESAEMRSISVEKRYSEITTRFASIFAFDASEMSDPEFIIAKITEIMQENATLRGKLDTMKAFANNAEMETKACRETISRLVNEAEKEQKAATKYSMEMDTLRLERDSAVARHGELESDLQTYRERLESVQTAWSTTKEELQQREMRLSSIEREIRDSSTTVRTVEMQLSAFKEQLCGLLAIEGYPIVEPFESAIKDRIQAIVLALKDKAAHINLLESKISSTSDQLSQQIELQRSAESRTKRLDVEYFEMKQRLQKYEQDYAAAAALQDRFRADKENYLRSLEKLARAMQVESIAADMGFDMIIETLISRASQLFGMENEALQERKTLIYNLQRKIKSLKEQLESRDLHLDLLRKKVAGLEEHLAGKSELEHEKDQEITRSRKLTKLVERYKHELHEATLEMNEMKARMLESSSYKNKTLEQSSQIEDLTNQLNELEVVREKQSKKISGLKGDLNSTVNELNIKNETVGNTIQALTSELRTTKNALEELTKRERQLLDLRQVMSRMLGLDVNSLAVPDYEIISRLEKLILAHQSSAITGATVSEIVGDMQAGFRAGYDSAGRVLNQSQNGMVKRNSRSPTRKVHIRTRSRSMSPSKRDTRAY